MYLSPDALFVSDFVSVFFASVVFVWARISLEKARMIAGPIHRRRTLLISPPCGSRRRRVICWRDSIQRQKAGGEGGLRSCDSRPERPSTRRPPDRALDLPTA